MRAIAIDSLGLVGMTDVAEPELRPTEVIVRMTSVGVCATDREIVRTRTMFTIPPGERSLILGHEGLGRVERVGAAVQGLEPGDVVVPVAYRRCEPMTDLCRVDMCPYGKDRRAGINSHGFFTDYIARAPEYLVKAEPSVAGVAMLLEPLTISLRGFMDADLLRQRWLAMGCYYRPPDYNTRALVIGVGPIGMLGVFVSRAFGWETVAVDVVAEDSPKAQLVKSVGATYVNARDVSPLEIQDQFGTFDVIAEAVQAPRALIDYSEILGTGGVFVILGWSSGTEVVSIDMARFVRDVLLTKQASIVATTGSAAPHFAEGMRLMATIKERYGDVLEQVVTHRYPAAAFQDALGAAAQDQIKAVIDF